jgi:hypothetical protein
MANPTGPRDQRKFERVPARLSIVYRLITGEEAAPPPGGLSPEWIRIHDAITKDISVGGFALVGERPFPVGGQVEVTFHLPHFKAGLNLTAEVVRSEPFRESQRTLHRGGLRILSIDPADLNYIEKHMHLLKKIQGELAQCLKELKKA